MMKKIIYLTMFLLVCSIAFAQIPSVEKIQQANQVMIQARNRTIYKMEELGQMEKLTGLQNAYTKVTNEVAKQQIRNNIIRFQARYNYTYNNYQLDKIGDMTHVVAQKRVKIIGIIPVTYHDEIVIDDEGEIIQEKLNWVGKILRWKMFGGLKR